MSERHETETRVTNLELFFDLVFVFAVTQVTSLLAKDPTLLGAVRGLFVLAEVWWAWTAYAWLTNTASADRPSVRLSLMFAMGAMFVVSLSVPQAFDRAALPFAVALIAVRTLHLVLSALTAKTRELRVAVYKLAPGIVIGGSLILVAAFTRGNLQTGLWAVALLFDYTAPLFGGTKGWHVSPSHFAERHGLILIIALGEAIIAIGVGGDGLELGPGLIAGAAAGLTCAFGMWWLYFDRSMMLGEKKLHELRGEARNRLARDSYSYLHLPLVMGIVLFALGAKQSLAHLDEPLRGLGAVGLGGGPALLLATLSILRKRHTGRHNPVRIGAALLCVMGGAVVGGRVNALAGIVAVAGVLLAVIWTEMIWSRVVRARAARSASHSPSA